MRYLVLLTDDDPGAWDRASAEERQSVMEAHTVFDKAVRAHGSILAGEALAGVDSATTLRLVDGVQTVVDGPYAETVEQLGGFYLIDVADLDQAVELCRLLPAGYTTEIRPVVEIEGYDS